MENPSRHKPPCSSTKKNKKRAARNRSPDGYDSLSPVEDYMRAPPFEVDVFGHVQHLPYPTQKDTSSSYDEFELSETENDETRGSRQSKRASGDNAEAAEGEGNFTLVKQLYEGRPKCKCCINWVETLPQVVSEAKKKPAIKNAIIVRRSTKKVDGGYSTSLHSVVACSPQLKDLLKGVIGKHPGINIGRKDAEFFRPFQPLVLHWDDLMTAFDAVVDRTTREHATAFFDAVGPEVGETIKDRDELVSQGLITLDLLWTLYKPGELAMCKINEVPHIMDVVHVWKGTVWSQDIRLGYFAWDGTVRRKEEHVVYQPQFTGTKKIVELDCIPWSHVPGKEAMFKALVNRGRTVMAVKKGDCMAYNGFAEIGHSSRYPNTKWIDGRIIIDRTEYDKAICHLSGPFPPPLSHDPLAFEPLPPLSKDVVLRMTGGEDDEDTELSELDYAKCHSTLCGFSLSTKMWAQFEIDNISDCPWNEDAFDQLVMSSRRKRIVQALVDTNKENVNGFDDFIKGKGKGLVILLQGPPGTGKTLTAESIADRVHLPLYTVHASELNVEADKIEQTLNDIMHRAAQWRAVLLIDEADAFLEARDDKSMSRNKRVSVFLRLIEWYSGVLILTTNRHIVFDTAFHSRIHLTLKFDNLDRAARATVWKNFLRLMPNNVHDDDVNALAELELNGRQIKNVMKMAATLAQSEKMTLCTEHIDGVLDVMELETADAWEEEIKSVPLPVLE